SDRDWSSDVCSSDLNENTVGELRALIAVPEWIEHAPRAFARSRCAVVCVRILPCHFLDGGACCLVENWTGHRITFGERHHWCIEIGRASCRERVWIG